MWELYDTTTDWTQAHDIAADHPDKLAHLQRLFLIEAVKHQVLPLDDRRVERFNSDLAGRPSLITGTSQLLFGGMGRLTENTVLNLKNKSYSVTADIEVPDEKANGVIVAQGGAFGGWSLYLTEGVPAHCYNLLGLNLIKATATEALSPGHHQVRVEFSLRRGRLGQGRRHHVVRRRFSGRIGPTGGEHPHAVLRGRDARCGGGLRNVGERRLHPGHQSVHRDRELDSARPGVGRPIAFDQPRRPTFGGDGQAVVRHISSQGSLPRGP